MLSVSIVVLALAVSGLCVPPKRRDGAGLITKCSASNTVALTFDDGPYIYMKEVVDTLKAAGGKGTFFLNGNNYGCIYDDALAEQVKYAYDNGFQIASHTWAHKDLTTLSRDELDSEMSRTEEAIQRITGATPAFIRPPYGNYNDQVLDVAGSRSQTLVTWDFDSGDSLSASVDQQQQAYNDIASNHPDNILSLQHEVYESSVREVLPYAIEKLQGAGYNLVTLAECLNMDPYLQTGSPADRDGSWQC